LPGDAKPQRGGVEDQRGVYIRSHAY
jgi:hypothetical protein